MSKDRQPFDRPRLLDIADRLFDATATNEDLQQLEKVLNDDCHARAVYLRYALVHSQLAVTTPAIDCFAPVSAEDSIRLELSGSGEDSRSDRAPATQWPAFRARRFAAMMLAIAAMLLIVVSLWHWTRIPHRRQATQPEEPMLAVRARDPAVAEPLSSYYDNRYLPVETVAMVGSRESGPTTLNVAQGATHFASSSGADVRVEGPAIFGVNSRGSGILFNGSVHARLAKPESTFSILASNLRILDLGTEFRVTMLNDQHVRVQVLDGEVDVQSRVRLPLYYWNFDHADGSLHEGDVNSEADLVFGPNAKRVDGIIGSGAMRFDNTADSFARMEHGTGDKAGTGAMACSSGISIEAMIVSRWSGALMDYDEIFRKEDGIYRILLSLQNDGNVGDYARPKVDPGPCLSFGLHIEQEGYSELDMPLDGRDGRPSVAELTDGVPHHIVATYDSFTGKKAIYIDGELCFEHSFPVGAMILSGGPAQAEIGNHRGFEPFHGVIDEVAFYDFALTPEEIGLHFQNVSSGKTYFGFVTESFAVVRWQPVTRVTAATQQVFNKISGLPVDMAATTDGDPL